MTTQLPEHPAIQFGFVEGRFALSVSDGPDEGDVPDLLPDTELTVAFKPKVVRHLVTDPPTTLVTRRPIDAVIGSDGLLRLPKLAGEAEERPPGLWLPVGHYAVSYKSRGGDAPTAHDIEVTAAHTKDSPLDLPSARDYQPGPGVIVHTMPVGAYVDGQLAQFSAGVLIGTDSTSGGVTDHGDLTGLDGDDHPQYALTDGSRGAFATTAQGALADSAVQPGDVADVVREGDPRLVDARPPTSHRHPYTDIDGAPSLPGPQVLSVAGADLSLSGGGGSVTLPGVVQPVNPQTGTSFTPGVGDVGALVTLSNAAAITVTLPDDAAAAFPVGARVDFLVLGEGAATFVAGAGASVDGTPSLVTRAQFSAVTAVKVAVDTWVVVGDLA